MVDFDKNWAFLDCKSIWITDGFETMHKAWSSIEGVPYYFSMSSVKLLGHMGRKNRIWSFPDSN